MKQLILTVLMVCLMSGTAFSSESQYSNELEVDANFLVDANNRLEKLSDEMLNSFEPGSQLFVAYKSMSNTTILLTNHFIDICSFYMITNRYNEPKSRDVALEMIDSYAIPYSEYIKNTAGLKSKSDFKSSFEKFDDILLEISKIMFDIGVNTKVKLKESKS